MGAREDIKAFQEKVWEYYLAHKRPMPWRDDTSPYAIVVSEIMLQQTQVHRVIPKFNDFMNAFPNFEALAKASNADVLAHWSGLGYNRRGLYLKKIAEIVVSEYYGKLPETMRELVRLPGIGEATAGAIMAYVFNKPVVYIETNIRTIFLHEFFQGQEGVSDAVLIPLISQAVKKDNPREWYWALMDYGTMLKQTHGNASQRSKQYTKQSAFKGSNREVRGAILRLFVQEKKSFSHAEICNVLQGMSEERVVRALTTLVRDRVLDKRDEEYKVI